MVIEDIAYFAVQIKKRTVISKLKSLLQELLRKEP
jgi:hypothetical protein